jgi:hypothetical protein
MGGIMSAMAGIESAKNIADEDMIEELPMQENKADTPQKSQEDGGS